MRRGIKKLLKQGALILYRLETALLPMKRDMIFFESNVGRNYTGNPRFIWEELVRRGLDKKYRCFYALEHTDAKIPGRVKKIRRLGPYYFYVLARAGIWVTDTRLPAYIKKRKGNIYIQTWHGTPLKKLALDMEEVHMEGEGSIEAYHSNFLLSTRTWDYLISQNHFSTEVFRRAFDFRKEILEIGYPRNDILIKYGRDAAFQKKWKEQIGLPEDKKVILYAPTWRDDEYTGQGRYKFNPAMDFAAMQEALSDRYVMLVKYHYLVQELVDWSPYRGFIFPFDQSVDIAYLYLAADLLVTDYSSVMFDYSLLKRPMFFYTYDMDNYKNHLRGFYFDLFAQAPGPVCLTTEELISAIINYRESDYKEAYQEFADTFHHADDGAASARAVDFIINIAEDGKRRK